MELACSKEKGCGAINDLQEGDADPWIEVMIEFLENDILPDDHAEARRIRQQSAKHYFIDGRLYKRSFKGGADLRCVSKAQGKHILKERTMRESSRR